MISGHIVDVISRKIFKGILVIDKERIKEIIPKDQVDDVYILPGLIDSHVHIESSMLVPSEFAKLAVQHGTVATVSDPHEIANVCGMNGVDFMIKNGKQVPLKFFFGAPSCVPATSFETSGSIINASSVDELLSQKDIYFLSEVMNFPGVINNDPELLSKLSYAKKYIKPIDGHAPLLSGADLKKYASAGITTDHECSTLPEAIEKIENNMKIQIREGSAAKNFEALHTLINSHPGKVMLCSDDIHPDDLIKGHINVLMKKGIQKNLDIFNLIRAATLNPVLHYNLPVGLLRKDDPADFIIVHNLENFTVLKTYINGKCVFVKEKTLFHSISKQTINKFYTSPIHKNDIKVKATGKKIRVIHASDGSLFTQQMICNANIENGCVVSDLTADVLKLVVVNRYGKSNPAVGFIHNFGLSKGAVASSIAHDSHNIIAVGTNDNDLVTAINQIVEMKGGIAVCHNNEMTLLPLETGGIMSGSDCFSVASKYEQLNKKVKEYGTQLTSPFMTLSFMALLVIPELKLSDKGLFDGRKFQFTSLFV